MKVSDQLEELEALARSLGVRVSYEPMTGVVSGSGGLCKVKGEFRVIIDRRLKPAERVQVLADALQRFEIDDTGLSPEVRTLLEGAA